MPRPQRTRVAPLRVAKNDIVTKPQTKSPKASIARKTSQPKARAPISSSTNNNAFKPTLSDNDSRTTTSSDQYYMTGALPVQSPAQKSIPIDSSTDTSSITDPVEEIRVIKYYRTRVGRSAPISITSPQPVSEHVQSVMTASTRPKVLQEQAAKSYKTRVGRSEPVATSSAVAQSKTQAQPVVKPSTPRAHTPQAANDARAARDSDELFGLSPGGHAARAQRAAQLQQLVPSRRTSLQQPASIVRAFGTPAVESSILALGRFKRRKRQGSIIRQMQEASELNGTLDHDLHLDDTNFGLDDFNPDGESTPVPATAAKASAASESEGSRTSSARKRKFAETQVQVTRSPEPQSSSPLSSHHELSSEDLPEASAEQDVVPATQDEVFSETMAPPLSSSSILSDPPSDPPSSPSSSIVKATRRRTRGPEISTLHLQSLLPQTRRSKRVAHHTAQDIYNEPSSMTEPTSEAAEPESSDVEEDPVIQGEAFIASARPRRNTKRSVKPPRKPSKPQQSRRKPLQSTDAPNTNKKQVTEVLANSKTPVRRYGRRHAPEEKENDDSTFVVVDESTIVEDKQQNKVMQKMRDKFAEIDDWEMEYESVDFSNASSPWR